MWSYRKPLLLRVQDEHPGELCYDGRSLFCSSVKLLMKALSLSMTSGERLGREQLLVKDPQLDQGGSRVTLVPFKDRTDFPM